MKRTLEASGTAFGKGSRRGTGRRLACTASNLAHQFNRAMYLFILLVVFDMSGIGSRQALADAGHALNQFHRHDGGVWACTGGADCYPEHFDYLQYHGPCSSAVGWQPVHLRGPFAETDRWRLHVTTGCVYTGGVVNNYGPLLFYLYYDDMDEEECEWDGRMWLCPNEPGFVLRSPPPDCNTNTSDRTNPCDAATGVKTQQEIDYASPAIGGLTFTRHYSSKGAFRTAQGMGTGWRHTYSRTLGEIPDRKGQLGLFPTANQSATYETASEACTSGWNDIKSTVFGGDLATATASFVGGSKCKISSGGSVVAYMEVSSNAGWPVFVPPTSPKYITRPNGSKAVFEQQGANWVNELNPSLKLEQSGTDWVFTDARGNRETYDGSGRLITMTSLNGQVTTLDYDLTSAQGGDDNSETLDKVTGPFGHTIMLSYDGNGNLASITTPDGVTQYAYDSRERLTTVTRPDASVREYHYESQLFLGHMTGITDENGDRFATWEYDMAGRAVRSEHAGGQEAVEFEFNTDGSTTATTVGGASRTYTFSTHQGSRKLASIAGDVCSICPGGDIESRTYDSNGFVDETTDRNGVVTQTVRNGRGLVTSRIEGKGTGLQRTTTTTWDATRPLPLTVTTPKSTTTYTYDANGNMLTATRTSGSLSRAWAFTYDTDGRVLTTDGPRTDVTDVTTFTYYNCTTGAECGQLHTVTNVLGHVTTYNSYDASGRVTLTTNPNGLQTALTYDTRGNVLTITRTPTSGLPQVTAMTYDSVGQLLTITSPEGAVLTYTYDDAHYLTSVTDNFGNKIEYTYDIMGNLTDEKTYDPSQVLSRQMQYTYDINNRIDTIVDGTVVSDLLFDLVGNLTTDTDGKGNTTTNTYDVFDRLDTMTDALSGVADFDYDVHDNVTQVVAANGATTNYVYDDLDNLVSESSPDRGLISYTYDEAGNRLTMTDARGITATYTYDALNRVTSVSYPTTSENVTYAYDAAGALGYLSTISDESGTTTYTYDGYGRVATDTRRIASINYTTTYQYDGDDNIVSVSYPSGRTITYGSNAIGEITQFTNAFGGTNKSIVNSVSYAPFGPVDNMTFGNGVVFNYPRQSDYEVTGITSTGIAGKGYSYDLAGNIDGITDAINGSLSNAYEYDALNRLSVETSDASASYALNVLQDNPAAFWRLKETSGTTAFDATTNGFDSSYVGTLTLNEQPLMASGDASVRVESPGAGHVHGVQMLGVTPTGIEMWFKTDDVSWWRHLLGVYDAPWNANQIMHQRNTGKIVLTDWKYNALLTSDGAVSAGVAHHLAIWYEAATNTSYMMIDGELQQDTHNGRVFPATNPVVVIGGYRFTGAVESDFLGNFDDVALYGNVVTAATFADRYSAGSASGASMRSYLYDANGNRTSLEDGAATTAYSYDTSSNRLNAIAGSSVQLDSAGNQIADQGGNRTFSYDDGGRLVEVRNNGSLTASYVHNALGQRVRKTAGSTDVVYIYDIFGNLLSEFTAAGAHIRDYVWMDGVPVAQVDAGESFAFLHFDHLGTPRWATDDSQSVVWRWDSDAFGSTAASDDPDGNGTPVTVNLRFPGQYYDVETGFHYNYYRTYDPSTGRYLESDPIGLEGGLNTYAYVGNNPLSFTDALGLAIDECGDDEDCIQKCLDEYYGSLIDTAWDVSPFSLISLGLNEAAEYAEGELSRQANRNRYTGRRNSALGGRGGYSTGRRQASLLAQFRRFNAAAAVASAGAVGFLGGAYANCAVRCAFK